MFDSVNSDGEVIDLFAYFTDFMNYAVSSNCFSILPKCSVLRSFYLASSSFDFLLYSLLSCALPKDLKVYINASTCSSVSNFKGPGIF